MPTAKDEELLALLAVNAREPIASLARKLGQSRTTVQDRLRRLEEAGVIASYCLKRGDATPSGIAAIVSIGIEPRRQIDVAKAIGRLPQVETLYTVSGKFDLVAMARTATTDAMNTLIDRIGILPGVTDVETSVVLATKVDQRL